ncbi:MAG: type II toxin-antitoxin system RelE/ParE family toxin [Eggerthellaceae bacterium]|nr:type II toxin-antitoxin system RelE/ParE family toxin [Eggerthellaceae bacterium]
MASEVTFTNRFELEYRAILVYLVDLADVPSAAGKLMDSIDNLIDLLSSTPEIKAISKKPALEALGLREYLVRSYVVLYRIEGSTVFLEHIFHSKQNYEAYV